MRRCLSFSFLVVSLCLSLQRLAAQELQCVVTVNLERLQSDARLRLTNFSQVVASYLNNHRWTNSTEFETDEDRIRCQIQFEFVSADITGAIPQYSARVFIASGRPIFRTLKTSPLLRIFDGGFDFAYSEQQGVLIHNEQINTPLASFLDYYALVILGYDADSFRKNGGTPYFERALRIKRLAQEQAGQKRGWQSSDNAGDNRSVFVDELLDARFLKLREDFFNYHYNGLDEFHKSAEDGRKELLESLKSIAEIDARFPRSLVVRRFFEAKATEIADVFRSASPAMKRELLEVLRRVDPSRLQQTYEPALASQ